MKMCNLSWMDVYEFIQRDSESSLATICAKEESKFKIEEAGPLFFNFCNYDQEALEEILSQANSWQIICEIVEDWDPAFGYTQGRTQRKIIQEIKPSQILVSNGNFAGIVAYSKDLRDRYGIFCALTSDYKDEPLAFGIWEKYGSSDCDMVQTRTFYLSKK